MFERKTTTHHWFSYFQIQAYKYYYKFMTDPLNIMLTISVYNY